MRKVTLRELEQAKRLLRSKRYACGDGLYQDALEIAEALIQIGINDMKIQGLEFIQLEEPE